MLTAPLTSYMPFAFKLVNPVFKTVDHLAHGASSAIHLGWKFLKYATPKIIHAAVLLAKYTYNKIAPALFAPSVKAQIRSSSIVVEHSIHEDTEDTVNEKSSITFSDLFWCFVSMLFRLFSIISELVGFVLYFFSFFLYYGVLLMDSDAEEAEVYSVVF